MRWKWCAWIGVVSLIASSALGSVVPAGSQPSVRSDRAEQVAVAKGKSPAAPERRLREAVTWLGGISETAVFAAVAAALLLIGVLGRRTAV